MGRRWLDVARSGFPAVTARAAGPGLIEGGCDPGRGRRIGRIGPVGPAVVGPSRGGRQCPERP